MALTRKMLKAMGIEEEKIDEIIEAHRDVTDALKEERDKYKVDAEALADIQKQYDDLKKEVESKEDDPYKEKYEKEHKAFDEYKKGVENERTKASKTKAYRELLKKAGVSEKRIDSVLRVTAIDEINLDDDGNVKDADKVVEDIKKEWPEFIVTESTRGAGTENPPHNTGGRKSKEEIMAIKDTATRQAAMLENADLFGI